MRAFRLFTVFFALLLTQSRVYAIDVATTPASEFATTAPVMITAYQTASQATSLAAVEIFNSSDAPVAVGSWAMTVTLKDGTRHQVATSTTHTGVLLPNEHVVLTADTTGTYNFVSEKYLSAITTIELGYTGTDVVYKPATAPIKDTTDLPFFRTYTTTGYSSAAQPFVATPLRPFYDDGLYAAPTLPAGLKIVEIYPYASDCAPNDESVLCGDYVKLMNVGAAPMSLDDLSLRTDSGSRSRTTSNTFSLHGTLPPTGVLAVTKTDDGAPISLTNSGGYVWLEDAWGLMRYDETMVHYEPAGVSEQGLSYADDMAGAWHWTTSPKPNEPNVITAPVVPEKPVLECPVGKLRNPETGRCRTIEEAVNALSVCEEGYERNAVTNRCRKIATATAANALTPCLEGQERNPATNRCRSIASAVAELLPCEDGYERNPATHRCKKITGGDAAAAAYPVVPVANQAKTDMAGWLAFGAVSAVALGYGIWEWRFEIASGFKKIADAFGRFKVK